MSEYIAAVAAALCLLAGAYGGAVAGDGDFRKYTFGGIEIVSLLDALSDGPDRPELFIGLSQADKDKYLKPGSMNNSVNGFVARINGRTILFDTGLGTSSPRKGVLVASLAGAGLAPADIDDVVITHFHFDHVGGLVGNGKPTFPRADLHLGRVEVEKWDPKGLGFIPVYGDRVKKFEFGDEVLPGVISLESAGHTPGHSAFRLESGDDKLLVIGDLVHFIAVQMPLPDVAVTYDSDPVQAVASRKRIFDLAIRENMPVASMHIRFPGTGTLSREGNGYAFSPLKD